MPISPTELALALLVVTLGAVVQASVGFGLALIAAPILLLVEPALIPGPLMAASLVLTGLVVHRERAHVDLQGMVFAAGGRVVGTALAAIFLATASAQVFDLGFGVLVVLGVVFTAGYPDLRPGRTTSLLAGGVSGLMGTISSIGGPPMALLYQSSGAARLRGTLAGFFIFGTIVSVAVLAAIGRFGWLEVQLALLLCPAMALGFALAGPFRARVSDDAIRPLVIGLSLVAAAVVLVRAIVA